jgi:hypothetical protein
MLVPQSLTLRIPAQANFMSTRPSRAEIGEFGQRLRLATFALALLRPLGPVLPSRHRVWPRFPLGALRVVACCLVIRTGVTILLGISVAVR